MRKGKTYQVTYLIPGVHRKPRVATMKYVATDKGSETGGGSKRVYVFDLRPVAGTQQIAEDHVISIVEAFGAQVRLPEILREGARVL